MKRNDKVAAWGVAGLVTLSLLGGVALDRQDAPELSSHEAACAEALSLSEDAFEAGLLDEAAKWEAAWLQECAN